MTIRYVTPGDTLMTRDEVCEWMQISRRVLWRLERAGQAPPRFKVGGAVRYPKSALVKFLSSKVSAAS